MELTAGESSWRLIADVSGGRLDPSDAPRFLVATVLVAYADAEEL